MALNNTELLNIIDEHKQDEDYYIFCITYDNKLTEYYRIYTDPPNDIIHSQKRVKNLMKKNNVYKKFNECNNITTYKLDKYIVTEKIVDYNIYTRYTLYQLQKNTTEYILK